MAAADAPLTRRPPTRAEALQLVGRWGSIASLVGLFAAFSIARPGEFFTVDNILDGVLLQSAILGIISFGLTSALVMGLFDLSIGGVMTLIGFVVPQWLSESSGGYLGPMLVAGFALGAAVGATNGFMVSYMGVSAFIGTLAMGSVLTGVVLGVSRSETISFGIPDNFFVIGQEHVWRIPNSVLIMLGVGAVLWLFLERTEPGRHMYAIGGNAEAARLSGIRVKRYALLGLGISALCAAIGGVVRASNLGVGQPQGVADVYLLSAFAASFIGASTLRPGQFHILGTFVGVLLLTIIDNGLSIMGVETYWQYIVKGLLLIFAIFMSGVARRGKGGINL